MKFGIANVSLGRGMLKPGSSPTILLVGVTIALLAVGYGLLETSQKQVSRVSLLAGAKLLEHDLGRMQLAFGHAGLNDFEIRDGQVFVPQNLRDRFLKALHDHDAIPEVSREFYEPSSPNPWATSQELQESALLRKKRMIRQLVLQLDFVAEAMVDYDELTEDGWPPTTRRSAAVVVRPQSDRLLESYQVDAIRNTICGAVAGLRPADIVITDIAAGHAYVGTNSEAIDSSPDSSERLDRAKVEQRIRDQLTRYGESIETSLRLIDDSSSDAALEREKSPKTSLEKPNAPIANQPASIDPASLQGKAGAQSPAEIAVPQTTTLLVKIRVPEQCVREFSPSEPAIPSEDSTLELRFQAFQTQIREELQPLLTSAGSHWQRHQIEVSMIHQPVVPEPVAGSPKPTFGFAFSKYSPAAEIGVVAATLLAIAWGWGRILPRIRRGENRTTTVPSSDHETVAARPFSDGVPEETKRRLKQMVDDDPEQAAEIIKQWIRGAA